jgi:hypothetical protein
MDNVIKLIAYIHSGKSTVVTEPSTNPNQLVSQREYFHGDKSTVATEPSTNPKPTNSQPVCASQVQNVTIKRHAIGHNAGLAHRQRIAQNRVGAQLG